MYTYDILENNTAKIRPVTSKDIEENFFDNLEVLKKQLTDEGFKILNDIDFARWILKNEGYYVDNLWHVSDVQRTHDCTDEQAQLILNNAMTSEWIGQEIFAEIDLQINK